MVEVQREFNQVEREKAKLKYQTDIAEIKRKYADDKGKMQEKIYALQAKIRKEDRDYILKEHEAVVKGFDVLLDSELEQTKLLKSNMPALQATQENFRRSMSG